VAGKEIRVKKYVVRLSPEERKQLEDFVAKGKPVAHLATRARILLKADCRLSPKWGPALPVNQPIDREEQSSYCRKPVCIQWDPTANPKFNRSINRLADHRRGSPFAAC